MLVNIAMKVINNKNILIYTFCIIIVIVVSSVTVSFLNAQQTSTNVNVLLPPYIARNIKAEPISGVKGAVRITFTTDINSKNDFMVGRSTVLPSDSDVALKAETVKIIYAGSQTTVIDSNLPPGKYYYVVLARDKILENDIELYPDVNYTSSPVVLPEKIVQSPVKSLSSQVTLLYARVVNKSQVLLTWKGVNDNNVVYSIYRGIEPLNSPQKLMNAVMLTQVSGNMESFIDRTITQSGKYYYAVTVKDIQGNENMNLIPDQNYLINPVNVVLSQEVFVKNISVYSDDSSVTIRWSKPDVTIQHFNIYRFSQPIENAQALALSLKIGKVDSSKTEYIDENLKPGKYYYAVLATLENGIIDTTLKANDNYTNTPVVISEPVQIKFIKATEKNGLVTISWDFTGSADKKYFNLYRISEFPNSTRDILDKGFLVDMVDIEKKEYIDSNIPPGSYYYAIVPENIGYNSKFNIIKGINCTETKVRIDKQVSITPDTIEKDTQKEKKYKDDISQKPTQLYLHAIISDTFYRGKYELCITMLGKYIKNSNDARDIAMANLFIGRSYIELKQYSHSLKYLMKSDIDKYYPKEAKFWRNFALSRVQ